MRKMRQMCGLTLSDMGTGQFSSNLTGALGVASSIVTRRIPLASGTNPRSSVLIVAMIVIAAAIFTVDTITHLEIAIAVLYVAVVLIAVRNLPPRGVLSVAFGCIILTLLSAVLTLHSDWVAAGIINSAISIAAIVVTTYLASRNQAAGMAFRAQTSMIANTLNVELGGKSHVVAGGMDSTTAYGLLRDVSKVLGFSEKSY